MVMSPQVSWLFFKARAKRPYLDPYGPSEQRGKTANWPRPGGVALKMGQRLSGGRWIGYVSI